MLNTKTSIGTGVIFVWAVLLYASTIAYGSLTWDDPQNVFNHAAVQSGAVAEWLGVWKEPYFGLYIPLTYTAWAIWYKLAAAVVPTHMAQSLHLLNVLMHAINGVLFYRLLLRYRLAPSLALVAALVFISHPLQAGTVGWISGFRDLFGAGLGLAALNSAHACRGRARALAAVLLFILSILAKPSIITLPLVAWLMDRRAWRIAIPALLAALPILIVNQALQLDTAFDWHGPWWFRLPVALDTLVFYAYKIVWPWTLGPDYGRSPEFLYTSGAWLWTGLIPVLVAAVCLVLRLKHQLRGAAVAILVLLPVLGLSPFMHQNFSTPADHYAYLALLGPAVMVLPWRPSRRALGVAFCLIALLALGTSRELRFWANDVVFYRHMQEANPRSFNGKVNLAAALLKDDPTSNEAEQNLIAALDLEPGHTLPLYYLSRLYLQRSAQDKVPQLLQPWTALGPRRRTRFLPDAVYNQVLWSWIELNYAIAAKRLGNMDECDSHLAKALAYDARNASVHYHLGLRHGETGHPEAARAELQWAAQLDPATKAYAEAAKALE